MRDEREWIQIGWEGGEKELGGLDILYKKRIYFQSKWKIHLKIILYMHGDLSLEMFTDSYQNLSAFLPEISTLYYLAT